MCVRNENILRNKFFFSFAAWVLIAEGYREEIVKITRLKIPINTFPCEKQRRIEWVGDRESKYREHTSDRVYSSLRLTDTRKMRASVVTCGQTDRANDQTCVLTGVRATMWTGSWLFQYYVTEWTSDLYLYENYNETLDTPRCTCKWEWTSAIGKQ